MTKRPPRDESSDAAWARRERWKELVLIAAAIGAVLAIIVGVGAFVLGVHNSKEITRVEHSACQVEPAGHECQVTKQESSRAASVYTNCIPIRAVGYPCPKPGSGIKIKPTEVPGGDAHQTPSTAHQQPSPHGGGIGAGHGQGGHGTPPSPENPGASTPPSSTPPSQVSESGTSTRPSSPAAPPVGETANTGPGVVEEVGSTVTQVGEVVCHLSPLGIRICN